MVVLDDLNLLILNAFLTRECVHAQWTSYSDGGLFTWSVGSVVNFQACAVNTANWWSVGMNFE